MQKTNKKEETWKLVLTEPVYGWDVYIFHIALVILMS